MKRVDGLQSFLAIVHATGADAAVRFDIADRELGAVRVAGQFERIVSDAQITGQASTEATVHVRTDLDKRRNRAVKSLFSGNHRTEARIRNGRIKFVPGHHEGVGRCVTAIQWVEISHDGEASGVLRKSRHLIGELYTRQRRVDHSKVTSDFCLCVGFRIQRVVMTGAASCPDQNAADVTFGRCAGCAQQLVERQSDTRQRTDLQHEVSAAGSLAI